MKTIASALIALSVIASLAAPASAFDAKRFWDAVRPHPQQRLTGDHSSHSNQHQTFGDRP